MAEKCFVVAVLCGAGLLVIAGWIRYARARYLDSFVFPDALRRKLREARPDDRRVGSFEVVHSDCAVQPTAESIA
jgi:hypothetical protein